MTASEIENLTPEEARAIVETPGCGPVSLELLQKAYGPDGVHDVHRCSCEDCKAIRANWEEEERAALALVSARSMLNWKRYN
jgi:hypothetical protein